MPSVSQIMPEHLFPHQVLRVNNNTIVEETVPSTAGKVYALYVFSSPKGPSNVVKTIKGGAAEFKDTYGIGPFSLYGQPYLNAYNGFMSGNIIGHCLRVTAKNAEYARVTICAQYKMIDNNMNLRLVAKIGTEPFTTMDLENDYTVSDPDTIDDFKEVKLFSAGYIGKGSSGNNMRIRIVSDSSTDKDNRFKNYYLEEYIYENGASQKVNEFAVVFNENAKVDGVSLFADTVINHNISGSNNLEFVSYQDGFNELWYAYKEANPDTELTLESFDPFLGINKYTKEKIDNLSILTDNDAVSINALSGVPLMGGNDGDLSENISSDKRKETLDQLYEEAFLGKIDPNIRSRNMYPTNFIYDANFNTATKLAIIDCMNKRMDCVAILDCGTNIKTKTAARDYVKSNLDMYAQDYRIDIEAWAGKATDPYSGKPVTATATYGLSGYYPIHIKNRGNGYKHVPLAGNTYGEIPGYIDGTLYPVYDEDQDSDLMDMMQEEKINVLSLNPEQVVVRDDQLTRDINNSNLSDLSNVLVLLDVIRDCRRICSRFEFNFSDPNDIAKFNEVVRDTLGYYADQQVHSITATYSQNTWEAKRHILHLNVAMAHRNIIKTFIIEVDVNRPD